MKKTIFSKAIAILGSIAMLVGVAACGQSNDSTKTAADGNGLTKVTFMLSWAPDTNHIGVYVAKNKGYFKQAGLDVDIVAVAQAGAEQAVNNGMADFALSNLTNVGIYTLKGAKIKQVMQVQQKPSAIWCSLASNKDIKSPKDFDGKTFATFGSNESDAVIRRMIQTDGGKGTFDKVTVGTSTFQTLSSKKADFGGLRHWGRGAGRYVRPEAQLLHRAGLWRARQCRHHRRDHQRQDHLLQSGPRKEVRASHQERVRIRLLASR